MHELRGWCGVRARRLLMETTPEVRVVCRLWISRSMGCTAVCTPEALPWLANSFFFTYSSYSENKNREIRIIIPQKRVV